MFGRISSLLHSYGYGVCVYICCLHTVHSGHKEIKETEKLLLEAAVKVESIRSIVAILESEEASAKSEEKDRMFPRIASFLHSNASGVCVCITGFYALHLRSKRSRLLKQSEKLKLECDVEVEKYHSLRRRKVNRKMDKSCTMMLAHFGKGTPAVANEIKEALEGNDVPAKIDAMKKAIMLLLNGETLPQLFITIVRYVLPSEDHTVQKLLLLYLEIIEKTDSKGKVLPEMILICENLRNNLQHPNEYICGVTLRFLCRLNEVEIVEPLIPLILANLEHRHAYIRRNAAVMSIYKLPQGEQLLLDAPKMIERVLSSEQEQSAKQNAFLKLFTCAHDCAINYLLIHVDKLSDWGELLHMVVLELIRKVCRTNQGEKGRYIKIIISLLSAPSTTVIFECAGTLVSLSSAPRAIRAVATTYCQLLLSQSDNNVKLILLEHLSELKSSHREIMVDMIMDVLRALSSPNFDIRRKILDIVLDLTTPQNINEVVLTLRKEVVRSQSGELEKNGELQQMLIQAIHSCAVKFPKVASTVVHLLMDFLGGANIASAIDVVVFVREIIETNSKLRVSIITRLDNFYQIRAAQVCSCALWIIGEYCLSLSEVESGIATIKQCLDDLPSYTVSEEGDASDASKKVQHVSSVTVSYRTPVVLADKTYATQSAASETAFSPPLLVRGSVASGNLRSLLPTGYFFLGVVTACTLTKLVLRLEEVQPSKVEVNKASTQPLLIMVSMLQLGQSSFLTHPIDDDSYGRIVLCIRLLSNTGHDFRKAWFQSCRQSFVKMLLDKQLRETVEMKAKAQIAHAQPEDVSDFYHLKSRKVVANTVIQDENEFLDHNIKSTNMKCLTAPSALDGECGFLAANLYAKSVFGEDAFNVSIEKQRQTDAKLCGYIIRIRSKTQGIALRQLIVFHSILAVLLSIIKVLVFGLKYSIWHRCCFFCI